MDLLRVVHLGFNIASANGDGVQFVGPNTPEQNLFEAGLGIEIPFPFFLNDGDWQWPFCPGGGPVLRLDSPRPCSAAIEPGCRGDITTRTDLVYHAKAGCGRTHSGGGQL